MNHNLTIEKFGIRLRPVRNSDVDWIIKLRTSPSARKFIGDTSLNPSDQLIWLSKYYDRPNDYYFIIEKAKSKQPVGTISIYDITNGQAEWGRWILAEDSPFAVASACLIYLIAFDELNLGKTYTRTVSDNSKVVSFHDSCGALKTSENEEFVNIGGIHYGITKHEVSRELAPSIIQRLNNLANYIEKRTELGT